MRLHLECPFNEEDEIVPTDPGFEHLSDPTLWLSLFDNDCGDSLCVYCSDADTDTTPVMDYVHDGEPRVAFGSLTLMITTLCAWFEAGVYTPDEDGWLEVDYDLQRKIARSLNPGLRRWQDNPFDACS